MTCPRCGAHNIAENATDCPWCGQKITEGAPAPAVAVMPAAPARNPYILAGVLGAVVIALIVALALLARPKVAVTQAPAAGPPAAGPPVTAAPAVAPPAPGPPVTSAPAVAPPVIPAAKVDPDKAAVAAYLQRIAYIEKQRQAVVNDTSQLAMLYETLKATNGGGTDSVDQVDALFADNPEAIKEAKEKQDKASGTTQLQTASDAYTTQLRALDGQLRGIQPVPKPAFAFAGAYDNVFAQYISVFQQVEAALQKKDVGALNAARFVAQKDTALRSADAQMAQLCQRYGITKPFDVTDAPTGGVAGAG